jgi:hypothetical protein
MLICSILIILAVVVIAIAIVLNNEQSIVEKAEKTNNMFNFYHILALMTSPNYKGYVSTEEEKKAMDDYMNANAVHDNHPIGAYFKMCKENNEICRAAGNFDGTTMSFNFSDLTIGFAVMSAFVLLIVLAV